MTVGRRGVSLAVAILALCGVGIATYLALVQLRIVAQPWDPVFGAGSTRAVLTSWVSRLLPIPDAALGAVAYLVEAVLAVAAARSARPRGALVACGIVAAGLLLAAGALVAIQAAVVHAFCSLCLVSAALSVIVAALAIPDAVGAFRSHGADASVPADAVPARHPTTTRRSQP